jgi:hypothetical protein
MCSDLSLGFGRALLGFSLLYLGSAAALPPVDPVDPNDPPILDRITTCIEKSAIALGVEPASITLGGSAQLAWSVRVPLNCSNIIGALSIAGQSVARSGSLTVQPMSNATYGLRAATPAGSIDLASTTLGVSLPPTVHINGSTPNWRALMIQALGTQNTKVNLHASVDMDLSGFWGIAIADGVTLTSESPRVLEPRLAVAAPALIKLPPDIHLPNFTVPNRDGRKLGPRLYTRMNSARKSVFETVGGNIRLHNFRFEGPQLGVASGSGKLERGIFVNYNIASRIEISNMEFSGWGGTGIYVNGNERDHRTRAFENVWIHDNFFHHNQHDGGDGYGVEVKHGSHALIERNVFDFNRHAISAGGEPGVGYIARLNLVLKGGGFHHCYGVAPAEYCHYTQQFDVHGSNGCLRVWLPIKGWFDAYPYGCGQAGESFEFSRNAIQYTRGDGIKVRGNPSSSARAIQNVFATGGGNAITQNGGGGFPFSSNISNPIQASGNQFGVDTYGKYGVCDFDGDGRDDLFQATGAQWWYMSGADRHWVFLQANTERIEQLGFGDFDGDRVCDVFSVHANDFGYYKSGVVAWRSLGTFSVPMSQLRFADFNGDRVTDVFRRAPDGQWWIVSPGYYGWTPIQSSSFPLSSLRFGDFNGDRIADVIAVEGGRWAVSWSGRQPWQALNAGISAGLANVLIGDIDGNGFDDIVRVTASLLSAKYEISRDGRGAWQTLAVHPLGARGYIGRFRAAASADLVSVDLGRMSKRFDAASKTFVAHGLYPY